MIHESDYGKKQGQTPRECKHAWLPAQFGSYFVCDKCGRVANLDAPTKKLDRTPMADLCEGWYPVRYTDCGHKEGEGWFAIYIYGAAPFLQFREFDEVDVERPMEFGPRIEMPR
jgi:hypothetical protein